MRFRTSRLILALALPFALIAPGHCPATADAPARHFRMGFTGFPHDFTAEAITEARAFCRENGDIIAHHIEGVPWAESLSGQPFSKEFLKEWEGKKAATAKGGRVY